MRRRSVLVTAMVMMAGAAAVPLVMNQTTNQARYVPEAYAFTISHDPARFRMNVSFVTADIPQQLFDDPAYQKFIGAHDGVFEVAVWHIREGQAQKVGVVSMPTAPNVRTYHRVGSLWRRGDVVAYQLNPGMQVAAPRPGEPGLPFASIVDNVSNDPASIGWAKISFEYTVEVH